MTLSDLQFVNENFGWVRYGDKKLYKTRDGGNTWQKLNYNINYFVDIQFRSENIGWGLIEYNLSKTINGGEDWIIVSSNSLPSGYKNAMSFYDSNSGWVSQDNKLFKTDDGGSNWERFSMGNNVQEIMAISDSICYIILDDSITVTKNGGNNWNSLPVPSTGLGRGGDLRVVNWFSLNDSTIIFTNSLRHSPDVILKTCDGFKSIEILHYFNGLSGLGCGAFWTDSFVELFDSTNIIALNNSYVMQSRNKGESWEINIQTKQNLNAVSFINETNGFAKDDDGYLLKTENCGDSWEKLNYSDSLAWQNIINSSRGTGVLSFQFINYDSGFVGGWDAIYRTEDGGNKLARINYRRNN